jgi:hypothetical protein
MVAVPAAGRRISHDERVPTRLTLILTAAGLAPAALLAGCGLQVSSPDLFALTRTGSGGQLTVVVNDTGTIRCNGGATKLLTDAMLLQARALVTNLDKDAKAKLHAPASAGSVFTYKMTMQDGTITFADTSAFAHPELAGAEQFAVQAARGPCGLGS